MRRESVEDKAVEPVLCARCSKLIEDDESVEFLGRVFCSDTCCEEFEEVVTAAGEPAAAELDDEASNEVDDLDDLEDVIPDEDDPAEEIESDFEDADY